MQNQQVTAELRLRRSFFVPENPERRLGHGSGSLWISLTLRGPCSCGPSGQSSKYHSPDDDRSVGLGDDCVRDADEEADQRTRKRWMHRKRNVGSEKADREAAKEGAG